MNSADWSTVTTGSIKKALYCAQVIDGLGDMHAEPTVILVVDNRVVDVRPLSGYEPDEDVEVIDLAGHTVLPGLIDLHVHVLGLRDSFNSPQESLTALPLRAARGSEDLRRVLISGITTVRDCGGPIAIALRDAIFEGSVPGPTVYAAGRHINPTAGANDPLFLPLGIARAQMGPMGTRLADGPSDVRKAVREQIREGADFIKTNVTGTSFANARPEVLEWSREELDSLMDEARRAGRPVAVHAHSTIGALEGVRRGATTIEHGFFLGEEALDEMARSGTYLVPTLSGLERTVARGLEFGASPQTVSRAKEFHERHRRVVESAFRAGVPLAMGSDCAGWEIYPLGENVAEVEAMVSAGIPAMDAIVASTSGAARALGATDVGVVAPGHIADLIAVSEDPVDKPSALRSVPFVMKRGRVVADRTRTRDLLT